MQGENERQWKKSEQEKVRHFLCKRVTKKFLEVSLVVVQNNGKEMYKKSVQHVQSCFLLVIRPIVFFFTVLVAFAA